MLKNWTQKNWRSRNCASFVFYEGLLSLGFFLANDNDLALLPQDAGSDDGNRQHSQDDEANQTQNHSALTDQTHSNGNQGNQDDDGDNTLQTALDDLGAGAGGSEQTQSHGTEQSGQQVAGHGLNCGQLEDGADHTDQQSG